MATLQVSTAMTAAFLALTALVVAADIALVRRAAPAETQGRWTRRAIALAVLWLAAHAGIAASGVLESAELPPRVALYLPPTMALGVWLALSPVGMRLAALPLALLVGLHAFRLPLEIWLHTLADAGALPHRMTWAGWNFDVVTGASAAALGLWGWRRPLPRALVLGWNCMGLALLVTVVTIAVLSTPTPLRRFFEGPPVLLPFVPPFNWIVGVHVWTALVGHLVVFRALRRPVDGQLTSGRAQGGAPSQR